MGGFAGGLLATSIATPIQQFGVEAAKLGSALNPATKNVEALTAALGVTGTEFEKNIKLLQELGDEEAAFEQTRKKMLGLVGSGGVSSLEEFGKDTTELSNSFAQLMTQMQAGFADMINSAGIFKFLAEGVKRIVTLNQANQNISGDPRIAKINEQRLRRAKIGAIRANKEGIPGFRELDQQAINIQDQLNIEKAIADAKELQRKIAEASMKKTEEEITFLEKHKDLTAEEFAIEVKIRELQDKGVEVDREKFTQNEKRLNQLQKERKLAEETAASFEKMANTIKTDIGNGIKGLIKGTQTLNEALSNILNKMADAFLNMAIFGNFAGTFTEGKGLLGAIFKANGGPVKGGKPYIVGEKGPELFTPGVSGNITPNHALGGSTNVVVNVDASGSSVQGDDQSANQLGELIAAAVQSEIVNQKMDGGLLS
jgi:biotin operon repressor